MATLSATRPMRIIIATSSSNLGPKTHRNPQFVSLGGPESAVCGGIAIHGGSRRRTVVKATNPSPSPASSGLYSAQKFELTPQNVDLVLEEVRPYLIADGGNIDVVAVEDGVVSVKLQGACGSCPSSTTTMTMGIERVLKEKFGDAIKDIRQVYDEEVRETTPEAVNRHLDILRPAITNYGGSVDVLSVEGGECLVKYVGPESIGSGVKAAIKEKFPDIVNVQLTG